MYCCLLDILIGVILLPARVEGEGAGFLVVKWVGMASNSRPDQSNTVAFHLKAGAAGVRLPRALSTKVHDRDARQQISHAQRSMNQSISPPCKAVH